MTRGDIGTLRRHMAALERHAPAVVPLYRAAAEREIDLARARGSIDDERAAAMRKVLATPT